MFDKNYKEHSIKNHLHCFNCGCSIGVIFNEQPQSTIEKENTYCDTCAVSFIAYKNSMCKRTVWTPHLRQVFSYKDEHEKKCSSLHDLSFYIQDRRAFWFSKGLLELFKKVEKLKKQMKNKA